MRGLCHIFLPKFLSYRVDWPVKLRPVSVAISRFDAPSFFWIFFSSFPFGRFCQRWQWLGVLALDSLFASVGCLFMVGVGRVLILAWNLYFHTVLLSLPFPNSSPFSLQVCFCCIALALWLASRTRGMICRYRYPRLTDIKGSGRGCLLFFFSCSLLLSVGWVTFCMVHFYSSRKWRVWRIVLGVRGPSLVTLLSGQIGGRLWKLLVGNDVWRYCFDTRVCDLSFDCIL